MPLSPLANWIVTVPFSEAFGQRANLEEFTTILRQFNRTDVIVCLSKLNCVLQTWRKLSIAEDLDAKIAKDFFAEAVIRRVAAPRDMPRRLFFPRLSILSVIKLALQVCGTAGRPVETGKDVGFLLAGCLIFNEGPAITPDQSPPSTAVMSQLLPLYDFTPRSAYEADVYRSLSMFQAAGSNQSGSTAKRIEFDRLFVDSVGVDPQTFAEFCFAIGAQYVQLTEATLTANPGLFFIEAIIFPRLASRTPS